MLVWGQRWLIIRSNLHADHQLKTATCHCERSQIAIYRVRTICRGPDRQRMKADRDRTHRGRLHSVTRVKNGVGNMIRATNRRLSRASNWFDRRFVKKKDESSKKCSTTWFWRILVKLCDWAMLAVRVQSIERVNCAPTSTQSAISGSKASSRPRQ